MSTRLFPQTTTNKNVPKDSYLVAEIETMSGEIINTYYIDREGNQLVVCDWVLSKPSPVSTHELCKLTGLFENEIYYQWKSYFYWKDQGKSQRKNPFMMELGGIKMDEKQKAEFLARIAVTRLHPSDCYPFVITDKSFSKKTITIQGINTYGMKNNHVCTWEELTSSKNRTSEVLTIRLRKDGNYYDNRGIPYALGYARFYQAREL